MKKNYDYEVTTYKVNKNIIINYNKKEFSIRLRN